MDRSADCQMIELPARGGGKKVAIVATKAISSSRFYQNLKRAEGKHPYLQSVRDSCRRCTVNYRVSYRRLLEIQARLLGKLIDHEIADYPVFLTLKAAGGRGESREHGYTDGLHPLVGGSRRGGRGPAGAPNSDAPSEPRWRDTLRSLDSLLEQEFQAELNLPRLCGRLENFAHGG
jgi:hypothetical protein